MYETSDIRKGLRVEIDGAPYIILEFQFVKPGKGTAFTRTKIRNLMTGAVLDRTFKSGEKLTPANTEDREMQYLYSNGGYHFMDNSNFEQVSLDSRECVDASSGVRGQCRCHCTNGVEYKLCQNSKLLRS